jgi:hypothetical protein
MTECCITYVFQMSSSSDHEKIDEIMSDCDNDDDDFMLVYAALELMGDNYDSRANKARTMHVMPGIVWAEIQLADRDQVLRDVRSEEVSFSSFP